MSETELDPNSLTERQKRELEFHEEFAVSKFDLEVAPDLETVYGPRSGKRRRSFNAYWYALERLIEEHDRLGGTPLLLDFGCGQGYYASLCGHIGYAIEGFDISSESVAFAEQYIARHGFPDRTRLRVSTAEDLDFPDEHFDVVAGIDILHHVDVEKSLGECLRVLKPGGMALFKEPIDAPLFDRIRNTRAMRSFVPNEPDFDTYITADERKVDRQELALMKAIFPQVEYTFFRVFTRFAQFGRLSHRLKWIDRLLFYRDFLPRIDSGLIRFFPPSRSLAGEVVVILRK